MCFSVCCYDNPSHTGRSRRPSACGNSMCEGSGVEGRVPGRAWGWGGTRGVHSWIAWQRFKCQRWRRMRLPFGLTCCMPRDWQQDAGCRVLPVPAAELSPSAIYHAPARIAHLAPRHPQQQGKAATGYNQRATVMFRTRWRLQDPFESSQSCMLPQIIYLKETPHISENFGYTV